MALDERTTYCPTKGIPMFIDLLLAIITFLVLGVAVNYIGHLVNK